MQIGSFAKVQTFAQGYQLSQFAPVIKGMLFVTLQARKDWYPFNSRDGHVCDVAVHVLSVAYSMVPDWSSVMMEGHPLHLYRYKYGVTGHMLSDRDIVHPHTKVLQADAC